MKVDEITKTLESVQSSSQELVDDVDVFVQNDPYGALMALLGMGIVFSILLLLYVVFTNTPKIYTFDFKGWWSGLFSRKIPVPDEVQLKIAADTKVSDMSGEVNAAIAAAIHLYRSEMHDYENTVLTISKVSRVYSPWSSKIYGLRSAPR
jgi:glutaconyl-CoA/methylmalonyl-CoA decarboxylase subunit delta